MTQNLARLVPVFALVGVSFMAPAEESYSSRRQAIQDKAGKGVVLLPGQHQTPRGPQENKDFIYLTGLQDPEAVLFLTAEGEKKEILFTRSGKISNPVPGAPAEVRPLADLRASLSRLVAGKKVYLPFADLDALSQWTGAPGVLAQAAELANVEPFFAEMRIVKSPEEIEILKQAADITAAAYVEVLKAAEPGMRERDLQAIFAYRYVRAGAAPSFTQIASGPNSVNIHFGATTREIKAGEVIVFDLGAWFERYTSDISRTIPVGGKFAKEQADLYAVVLAAQKEGIRLMVAGNDIQKTQTAVEDALLAGLQKLGLVTDPASPWQRRFHIQHGFIHGIGLDVHDVWPWFSAEMRRGLTFKPNMVLTMEPGLYFPEGRLERFPPNLKSLVTEEEWKAFAAQIGPAYKRYANLGCRIEDDVLVLEAGNSVLTAGAPKEIAEIEKTMRLRSPFNDLK
ncbi:MAG: M24 family metallopeptidase [Candidatus Aminicenantes bacterium]|nr:M24 family metallopeptidase [Candidatus Aminicenantes bacterium]